MVSSVAPARSMDVAAEWRKRLAPYDGGLAIPARASACLTTDEMLEETANGPYGAQVSQENNVAFTRRPSPADVVEQCVASVLRQRQTNVAASLAANSQGAIRPRRDRAAVQARHQLGAPGATRAAEWPYPRTLCARLVLQDAISRSTSSNGKNAASRTAAIADRGHRMDEVRDGIRRMPQESEGSSAALVRIRLGMGRGHVLDLIQDGLPDQARRDQRDQHQEQPAAVSPCGHIGRLCAQIFRGADGASLGTIPHWGPWGPVQAPSSGQPPRTSTRTEQNAEHDAHTSRKHWWLVGLPGNDNDERQGCRRSSLISAMAVPVCWKPSRKVACSILIAANCKNGVALACQAETELFHQWPQARIKVKGTVCGCYDRTRHEHPPQWL